MNRKNISQILTLAIASFLILGTGCATKNTEAPAEAQAAVATEAQNAQKAAEAAMPAKMDMNQMMDMKHQCMSDKHSGKKCNHEVMSKCQETMDKKECKKMMKEIKKQKASK